MNAHKEYRSLPIFIDARQHVVSGVCIKIEKATLLLSLNIGEGT